MKVLITGAQFKNKGAQSLLFSVVDYLNGLKRNIEIFYLPLDNYRDYTVNLYKFNIVFNGESSHKYEAGGVSRLKAMIKEPIKMLLRRPHASILEIKQLHTILPNIDLMVDVSGYQLSSKWGVEVNKRFLGYIEEAKKYDIPVILMPQSFGPFNYASNQNKMDLEIKNTLSKVEIIFAREKEGFDILTQKYNLQNVRLSPDLVLQQVEYDLNNIYVTKPALQVPKIQSNNNVGIIPNEQNFIHGDRNKVLEFYKYTIEKIIDMGKNVVIFRHSADLEQCQLIYKMFEDNQQVSLVENEFSCFEYSEFIANFDYLISSRYHAIIHAYKKGIPSIILGWAIKYSELADIFNQGSYVFNSAKLFVNSSTLVTIQRMNKNYTIEREIILEKLEEIQNDSCLKSIDQYLTSKFNIKI